MALAQQFSTRADILCQKLFTFFAAGLFGNLNSAQ